MRRIPRQYQPLLQSGDARPVTGHHSSDIEFTATGGEWEWPIPPLAGAARSHQHVGHTEHRRFDQEEEMSMRIHGLAASAAAAAALLLGLTVPAVAASGPAAQPFAAQARAAHLSAAQTDALRAEVNRVIAATGGTQVALNEIDLNGRGDVLVAIPGESHPRNFSSPASAQVDHCTEGPVYSGYFCAYSGTSFQGSEIQMYYCQSYGIPWSGNGSWINDQTPGTTARFYNNAGTRIYTTPPPYSYNTNYSSWTNVHTIRPC
jgi:hypothetical protein